MQITEDVDELVELPPPPAPAQFQPGNAKAPDATAGATPGFPGPEPSLQLRTAHERALQRIGIVYAPLQATHAFRYEAAV
jgi:hypothetical protein